MCGYMPICVRGPSTSAFVEAGDNQIIKCPARGNYVPGNLEDQLALSEGAMHRRVW
jgi:hypothetical protein